MRARRVPVLLASQLACDTCGRDIDDPLAIEAWGRHCSARCYHARGLPVLFRRGA